MGDGGASARKVPTIFCTTARKVEPIGSDCVRIYLCVEKNGAWEDRAILEMPAKGVFESSQFVVDATTDFTRRASAPVIETAREKLLAH